MPNNFNYTKLDRPYSNTLERADTVFNDESLEPTRGSISSPAQIRGQAIGDQSMGNVWVTNWIKSKNYKPRSQGFYIDGVKGYAEFLNMYVTGTITGSTLQTSETGARVVIDGDKLIAYDDTESVIFEIELTGTDVGDVTIGDYAGGQGLLYDKSEGTMLYKNLQWSEVVDNDGNKPENNAQVNADFPQDINLVGYWTMDEGIGENVSDISNNANNGALLSGMTNDDWIQGTSGTCIDFDNNGDDGVEITDASSIQNIFDGGASVSFWVYVRGDGGGNEGRILDKAKFIISVDTETASQVPLKLTYDFSGTDGVWQTTNDVFTFDTWYHVVLTYDNSSVSNDPVIYIDGESVGVTESVTPVGTRTTDVGDNLFIGNNTDSNRGHYGYIDEVRIYNIVLDANQVRSLFYNPGGPKSSEAVNINKKPGGLVQERAYNLYDKIAHYGHYNDGFTESTFGDVGGSAAITRSFDITSVTSDVSGGGTVQTSQLEAPTFITLSWDSDYEVYVKAKDNGGITTNTEAFIGIHETLAATHLVDGAADNEQHAGFYITDGTLYASNGEGASRTQTQITGVTLGNFNDYRIKYLAADKILFYVNDVLAATHTTNIPSGSANDPHLRLAVTCRNDSVVPFWWFNNNYSIFGS